jgi:hypothetical protein
MEQLLKSFPVQDVALFFFLLGVWYSDRRNLRSRESQGKRLGDVEKIAAEAKQIAELLAARVASGKRE